MKNIVNSLGILVVLFVLTLPSAGAQKKITLAKASSPKGAVVKEKTNLSEPAPKSVFTVDKNSRDPFFPKSNRPVKPTETPVQNASVDVVSLLRAGFQGTMAAGEKRLAVIHNAILETGRTTSIRLGSRPDQTVKVTVLEVLKDGVILEVQGQKQPVTLTRPESNE